MVIGDQHDSDHEDEDHVVDSRYTALEDKIDMIVKAMNNGGARATKDKRYAKAFLGNPMRIETVRQFNRHWGEHKVSLTTDQLPYKKCYCLPILNLRKIKVSYHHTRGAVSIVKFSPRAQSAAQ